MRRTCLHWACKRNHAAVVAQLLLCGADKEILSRKGERPAQLTSHKEIRRMLGGTCAAVCREAGGGSCFQPCCVCCDAVLHACSTGLGVCAACLVRNQSLYSLLSEKLEFRRDYRQFPHPAHQVVGIFLKNWKSCVLKNAMIQPVTQTQILIFPR